MFNAHITGEGSVEIELPMGMKRNISISDYANIIQGLADRAVTDAETETFFKYPESMFSVSRNSNGHIINMYFEEREVTIKFAGMGKKKIIMPNVLVTVELHKTSDSEAFYIKSVKWLASNLEKHLLPTNWTNLHSKKGVWVLPMPNVYDTGSMCTGGNQLPSIMYTNFTILDTLYSDILVGSAFNSDLRIQSIKEFRTPKDWINVLAQELKDGNVSFPYNLLTD